MALPLFLTACSSGDNSVLDAARIDSTPSARDTTGTGTGVDTPTSTSAPETARASASASAPVTVIEIVGFQWQWAFNYKEGPTNQTGAVYDVGTTTGNTPTLYLPQGQKVRFELKTLDVIHSFYVPSFLYKLDLVPGKAGKFEITPEVVGDYDGRCAELCGADHSEMRFVVKIVPVQEYQQHLAQLKSQGQVGAVTTAGT